MNLSFYLKQLKVYSLYKLNHVVPCSVLINVTFRCNLKCNFCKARLKRKVGLRKELSTKQIFALIDDLHRIGVPHVLITGGEPLLRQDIEKIGFYLKKKRIVSVLTTNGTLITKKKAKWLSRAYDSILISLDGLKETHDMMRGVNNTYKRAVRGLGHLIAVEGRNAKVGVNFLLRKNNCKELAEMVELFNNKIDTFSVLPLCLDDGIDLDKKTIEVWKKVQTKLKEYGVCDQVDQFLEEPSYAIGKKYCDAGELYFSFNPEGTVMACPARSYHIGNINNKPFYTIWKKGLDEKVKEQIKNCPGCYLRCTTEKSMLFRKNPLQLLGNAIKILRTYRF